MREIKFRGKRIDNEEWIYGDLCKNLNGGLSIMPKCFYGSVIFDDEEELKYNQQEDGLALGGWFSVIPETVGQYWNPSAGLFLFTDDLFMAECSPGSINKKKERLCKISNCGKGMEISIWHKKEWWYPSLINLTNIKLVGNIHDNPGLLK